MVGVCGLLRGSESFQGRESFRGTDSFRGTESLCGTESLRGKESLRGMESLRGKESLRLGGVLPRVSFFSSFSACMEQSLQTGRYFDKILRTIFKKNFLNLCKTNNQR